MKLPHPFVQLPLLFDAARLEAEIAALGEDGWLPHPQGFPGNSMLPLIACEGSAQDESFAGQMAPTPHLLRCPYLHDTIAALGVIAGRTRLMRLSGHAEVTRHADQGYYWADRVRVHVPIVTQPTVRFDCGDTHTHMAAGECWIFDTWRQHRVLNDDTRSRIHLVVDTIGSESFWALVDQGRTHHGEPLSVAWNPRRVEPSTGPAPKIHFERDSLSVVMTPWELGDRLRFLMSEAEPGPTVAPARELTEKFIRQWRWLWAEWGSRPDGWPVYRQASEAYLVELIRIVGKTPLGNELGMVSAVSAIVRRIAVSGADALPAGASSPVAAQASTPAPMSPQPALATRTTAVPGLAAARPAVAATAPAGVPAWGSPGGMRWGTAGMNAAVATAPAHAPRPAVAALPPPRAGESDPVFDQPVFIVSSPRSGSTMLFEAMATAPGIHSIGGESHGLIEGVPSLNPATRGFDSNRLGADAATPQVVGALRQRFHAALRDREGKPPAPGRVRMLEKTPKNSLRIPFLSQAFPEGVFVYLYRDPRQVLGSMMDAWQSGKFRTYPNLPGWTGLPWSLLLVPGWRELNGLPLADVVARQWEATTRLLLDDLEAMPASHRRVIRYESLIADPQGELEKLCASVGLGWDRAVGASLPLARYTLSQPSADKWRKHEAEILPRLPGIQATLDRAARFAGS